MLQDIQRSNGTIDHNLGVRTLRDFAGLTETVHQGSVASQTFSFQASVSSKERGPLTGMMRVSGLTKIER